MEQNTNYFAIDGILYAKLSRPYTNKKGEEQQERSIVLEVSSEYDYTDVPTGKKSHRKGQELLLFRLFFKLNDDLFEVGDSITVRFRLKGQLIKTKKGEDWYKQTQLAVALEHRDINVLKQRTADKTKNSPEEVFPTQEDDDDSLPF